MGQFLIRGNGLTGYAPLFVILLAVGFICFNLLGMTALLPNREIKSQLFKDSDDAKNLLPLILHLRAEDERVASPFRVKGTIYWKDPPQRYFESINFETVKTEADRSLFITTVKAKWYGNMLTASQFPDEQVILSRLARMDPRRLDFNPHFFAYGHFYIYSIGAVLKLSEFFGLVELSRDRKLYLDNPEFIQRIFVIGKLFGIIMGGIALWFFFRLGVESYNLTVGLLAVALGAFTPFLTMETHTLKPYVFGMVWFMLALIKACHILNQEQHSKYNYAMAGLWSGLATSSSYFYAFSLVGIILSHTIRVFRGPNPRVNWSQAAVVPLFLVLGTFAVAFFSTSPYVILSFDEFFAAIKYHAATSASQLWLTALMGPGYHLAALKAVGSALGVPLSLVVAMGVLTALRRRTLIDALFLSLIVFYYFFYFSALTFQIEHHMVGILPILVLLGARWLVDLFVNGQRLLKITAMALIIFTWVVTTANGLFYNLLFSQDSSRIKAGEWVNNNIPAGSTIGHSLGLDGNKTPYIPYRYFEYRFANDETPTLERIKKLKPDYYIAVIELEREDPFLKNATLRQGYAEIRSFRYKVPVLGKVFENTAAFYWPNEIKIFKRKGTDPATTEHHNLPPLSS